MSVELDKSTGQIYDEDHKEYCIQKYLAIRSNADSERNALRMVQDQFCKRFKEDIVPDLERLTRWIREHDDGSSSKAAPSKVAPSKEAPSTSGRTRQSRRAAAEAQKKLVEISTDSDESSEEEPQPKRSRPVSSGSRGRMGRRNPSPEDDEYSPQKDILASAMQYSKRGRPPSGPYGDVRLVQRGREVPHALKNYSTSGRVSATLPNVTIVQGQRTKPMIRQPMSTSQRVQPSLLPTTSSGNPASTSSAKEQELLRRLKDSKISKPLMNASLSLLRAVETAAASKDTNVSEILKRVIQNQSNNSGGQPMFKKVMIQPSSASTMTKPKVIMPQRNSRVQQILPGPRPLPTNTMPATTSPVTRLAPQTSLLQMVRESLKTKPQVPQIVPTVSSTVVNRTIQPEKRTVPTTTTVSELERKIYEGIISLKGISLDLDCEEIINSDDEEEDYNGNYELKEKPKPSGLPKPHYVVDPDGETGSLDMGCEEIQAEPLELYCHKDNLSDIQLRTIQREEAAFQYYNNTKSAYEKMGATFTIMDSDKAQQLVTGGSNVRQLVQQLTNQPVKTSHPVYLQPPPGSSSSSPLFLPAGSYIIQVPAGGQLPTNKSFFTQIGRK